VSPETPLTLPAVDGPSNSMSLTSFTNDTPSAQDTAEEKRGRVLDLSLEVVGRCPICFVLHRKPDTHWAYRCPTNICGKSNAWNTFKKGLRLGSSVCPRCALPYGAPCNHVPMEPNTSFQSAHCDYNDLLKEIAFTIYEDAGTREAAFAELGVSPPKTISLYRYWLGQNTFGSVINFIEVLAAYWLCRSKGTH
jgi:hypothetical protein